MPRPYPDTDEHRAYMREYQRKRRLAKGRRPHSSLGPPAKPDRSLHATDPQAYKRQYMRWWQHNGYTARI